MAIYFRFISISAMMLRSSSGSSSVSYQEHYFSASLFQGSHLQTIQVKVPSLHCTVRCNLDERCSGVLMDHGVCTLAQTDLGVDYVPVNISQIHWRKGTSIAATVKVTSEGNYVNFQHNFNQDGMFVVNGQKITVNHRRGINILTYDIFARTHNFQRSYFNHQPSANSVAVLNFINTLPNGLIVMMAVYDTGNACHAECQTAMELVGGSGLPNGHRESVALLGYTGYVCGSKPTWVQELRKSYFNSDAKPVTIEAEITVSSIYC